METIIQFVHEIDEYFLLKVKIKPPKKTYYAEANGIETYGIGPRECKKITEQGL